jgi:hypothetical protein
MALLGFFLCGLGAVLEHAREVDHRQGLSPELEHAACAPRLDDLIGKDADGLADLGDGDDKDVLRPPLRESRQ